MVISSDKFNPGVYMGAFVDKTFLYDSTDLKFPSSLVPFTGLFAGI